MQAIAAIDIALFDVKARRAGLPLAKLLGAHRDSVRVYNTSGGYLNAPLGEVLDNVDRSIEAGLAASRSKSVSLTRAPISTASAPSTNGSPVACPSWSTRISSGIDRRL